MATTSREARRRRILERGSDRLALITGRIHSLPSSPESDLSDQPSPVVHLSEDKDFSSFSPNDESSTEPVQLDNYGGVTRVEPYMHKSEIRSEDSSPSSVDIDGLVTVVHLSEDKDFSSFSPKHESSTEPVQLDNFGGVTRVEPYMRKSEIRSEDSSPSSMDIDGKLQSTPVSSTIQTPSISTSNVKHHSETQAHHHKIFTPKQISSAVAASEITRIFCSLAAAILVFLSYIGYPILGSNLIKNIVLFRPLYLLLVTNISIVLAHLLLEKQRGVVSSGKEANSASLIAAFSLAGQLGKALEVGLVLQHVVGALFMDCSVYSIAVICSLSLAQKLGW